VANIGTAIKPKVAANRLAEEKRMKSLCQQMHSVGKGEAYNVELLDAF
jgi:hypothetical protein